MAITFLGLPAKIRFRILDLPGLLYSSNIIEVYSAAEGNLKPPYGLKPQILQTCKTIHQEGVPLLYENVSEILSRDDEYWLTHQSFSSYHGVDSFSHFLMIKHFHIRWDSASPPDLSPRGAGDAEDLWDLQTNLFTLCECLVRNMQERHSSAHGRPLEKVTVDLSSFDEIQIPQVLGSLIFGNTHSSILSPLRLLPVSIKISVIQVPLWVRHG